MVSKKSLPDDESSIGDVDKIDSSIDVYANIDYDTIVSQEVDAIPGWAVVGRDRSEGTALIKDDLVGSPFAIVGVVFRPSNVSLAQYVSVLAISKEYKTICINDGSTGIRSQILKYCVDRGIARYVGPESDPKFIAPVNNYEWNLPAKVSLLGENATGAEEIRVDIPFRKPLDCPRGLRVSRDYEFDNPETGKKGKATTYYLG